MLKDFCLICFHIPWENTPSRPNTKWLWWAGFPLEGASLLGFMYLVIYSRTWQVKALATQVCVLFVWCPSGSSQLPCLMSWFNLFVFTMLLLGLFDFRRGRHISQLFSVPFVGFPQPCGLQYRTSSHCHCSLSDGGPCYWPEWSHCIIYTNLASASRVFWHFLSTCRQQRERLSEKLSASQSGAALVQELCESRGGRPGLSVLTSLLVSEDVNLYWTMLVPDMSTDIRGH